MLYLFGTFVYFAIFLPSLVSGQTAPVPQTSSTPRVVHRSVLQILPTSFDPLKAMDTNSQLIVTNSFDGLVDWSPEEGLQPKIAESWTFSDQQTKITFKLRDNLYFTDKTKLTSGDVEKHFNRLLGDKYFGSHYQVMDSISVVSDSVFEIKLRRPSSQFLNLLAGAPARIVKLEKNTKKNKDEVLGIGPYIPMMNNEKTQVVLKKNSSYWGKKAAVDEIQFKILSDEEAIKQAIHLQIDDISIASGVDFKEKIKQGTIITNSTWTTWVIGFDQRVKLFKNKLLREELRLKIQSTDFVQDLYPQQMVAAGLFPFGMPGYIDSMTKPQIKEAATFKTSAKKIDLSIEFPKEVAGIEKIIQWMSGKLKDSLILNFKPKITPFSEMLDRYANGKMGAFLLGINAEYPDTHFLVRALRGDSGSNFLGIKESQIDELIDRAERSSDILERSSLHKQINKYLIQESYLVPLMHLRHQVWMRDCVSGIKLNSVNEGYTSYREIKNECFQN